MWLLFYYLIIILIFTRSLISNISLFFVLKWLASYKVKDKLFIDKNNIVYDFFVIIPVLREQKVIKETIEHFLKMDYPKNKIKILIVTTEKEFVNLKDDEKTTIDIVSDLSKQINQNYNENIIQFIHYPKIDGKMVDQLNYAFSFILKEYKKSKDRLFISIYNADSKPNKNTFNLISSRAFSNEKLRVFQQSAIFLDNFYKVGNGNFLKEKFLQANGTLHSRWTLAHEFTRLFRQSYFLNKFRKKLFLSHCVGHGLFLRGDLVSEIKEMPTGTVTEDLFFGYVLSLLGESINPIPVVEIAEMPDGIMNVIKQKYVWFFGPLDHLNYERYFFNKFPNKAGRLLAKWFTFQGIFPALIWLLQGWFLVFIFLYPILSGYYNLVIVSLITFLFYGPLSYWLTLSRYGSFTENDPTEKKILLVDKIWVLIFSLPVVVIHSIPPVFSIYSKMRYKFTGKEPFKPKTER